MHRGRLMLVCATAALAGCLSFSAPLESRLQEWTHTQVVPNGVPPATRGADEYYLLVIHGRENAHRLRGEAQGPQPFCDAHPGFAYDRAKRSVQYDPARWDLDTTNLKFLVLVRYAAPEIGPLGVRAGCNAHHDAAGFDQGAAYETNPREDIHVELAVEVREGLFSYNQTAFVPMGKKVHVNLTRVVAFEEAAYYVTGDFYVENLGAWKREDVVPYSKP